jgi:prophage regulatory protein
METQSDCILRIGEVTRRVGLARATLYRYVSRGDFPAPVRLGSRASGWRLSEVLEWVQTRPKREPLAPVRGGR